MANTIRIKRRLSGNAGAPGALQNAELAFNEVDNILYYGKGLGAGGAAQGIVAIGGDGAFISKTGDFTDISGTKTFVGTINVPTQITSDNSTKAASTAFVKSAISGLATQEQVNNIVSTFSVAGNTGTSVTFKTGATFTIRGDNTIVTSVVSQQSASTGDATIEFSIKDSSITGGKIANGTIANTNLQNSAITVGSTSVSLGGTVSSLSQVGLSAETYSTSATVSAGTNNQGQGALSSDYNIITSASNNPSGVTLPSATVGRRIIIVNRGANPVNIYPATGSVIDGLSSNSPLLLSVNGWVELNASSTTQWYSSYGCVPQGVSLDQEVFSTSASVTASSTNSQAGATALTSDFSIVTSTPSSPSAVRLPTATVGRRVVIINRGNNTVNIYPASGASIDSSNVNLSIALPAGSILEFIASSSTQWYSSYNALTTPSVANGGTGVTTTPTNGQLLIGNGTGYTLSTLTAGTGIGITNGAGSITISNTGVTSFSGGTTGLTPSTTSTGAITLGGTLAVANGGTGTTNGSITGTGALTFTAGGTNTNVTLVPNGTGSVDVSNKKITNVATPTNSSDAANKGYVDSVVQGLSVKDAVKVATTATLTATYNNGTSGVGATLTNNGTQAALSIDGISLSVGSRVLVKNQTANPLQNGIYEVTTVGTASTNWVLTRSTDFDNSPAGEIASGDFVFVSEGTTNGGNGYVVTTTGTITVGTTAINFTQFSGAGTVGAGDGLGASGNTLFVNPDSRASGTKTISIVSDEVRIDSSWAGHASITTIGTITSGTWNATTITVPYGGTGATSFTSKGIIYGNATSGTGALQSTAAGVWDATNSCGQLLSVNSSGVPTWTDVIDGGTF